MVKVKSTYMLNLGQFLSVLVMISFTSCDQLYSSREWTDGIMVLEDCVLEALVADPNKIVEYGVKQLIIDNCASPGSCYREKYEFNSCGKIEKEIPAMRSTNHSYEYDDQCRVVAEVASDLSLRRMTYFKDDSAVIAIYSSSDEDSKSLVMQSKCKLLPASAGFLYHPVISQIRVDTIGSFGRPCGEYFEGKHITKTRSYDYGMIASIQYFDSNERFLFEEDYQYLDSLGNSINFNSH